MAEVRPLKALHYSLDSVSSLGDVVAPPYDVIDAPDARRPARALAVQRRRDRPARRRPAAATRMSTPPRRSRTWTLEGILAADREAGALGARAGVRGAGRLAPHAPRLPLPGARHRLRPRPRSPARAHPARAQGGPAAPDPGDAPQPLPHLLPPRGERLAALRAGDTEAQPGARPPTPTAPSTASGGSPTRQSSRRSRPSSPTSELLIADGHHRYETARTYAEEVGGDGEHRYTLMALVSLEDPGLTVFGYHRLLTDLGDSAKQEALADALREHFDLEEVPARGARPGGRGGDRRLRLRGRALQAGLSPAPQGPEPRWTPSSPATPRPTASLDAAILETLILRGALGMTPEDVEAKRGIAYTASATTRSGASESAPTPSSSCAPRPVEQVRAVAAAGETMPPKSTYFFPKLLTGLVFNPLSGSPRDPDLHRARATTARPRSGTAGASRRTTAAPTRTARSTRPTRRSASPARSSATMPSSPPTSCASRTTSSSPAPSWRPRPRPPSGSRTESAASPPRWRPSSSR